MKKILYVLILSLVVVSGAVFANREIKNETSKKSSSKPLSLAERKAALKKWEATPDGIIYKKWQLSPVGKKVHASVTKISKPVIAYTNMDAVITSLSLPPDSNLGFGIMVNINGDDYILVFGPEKVGTNILSFKYEFEQLHQLKVNDKIIIKSHHVSQAPKYAFPIIAGDYVEKDGKTIYKREVSKDGC
ncbi:hypothetical protein SAMN05444397_11284 [Flavobacterium aquidurense]|uniref:Uncharacterized protein n=1 Tax=Flavobacterium frigidimaris TaxID=262320 RepID=A0ABX4BK06_FLAFR|nr:hypothetical protein [Flavobacterium frigidimaris]OXA75936.1 hypothetical protein B0A65_20500 [Flavobacterium frigidimaris]SDZ64166.1 hypothetical protein SAMN05444397_11284 [Flavobacterium aquidurense]